METAFITIDASEIPGSERIKDCARQIEAGRLVVFPTETVYGIACAVEEKAIARLNQLKSRPQEKRYTLHIGSGNKIFDYVPDISAPAEKLMSNLWPGPLTIIFQLSENEVAAQIKKIGSYAASVLYRDGTIGLRCPDNRIASELLEVCNVPVVAPSANLKGTPPAVVAAAAGEQLNGLVDVIINGGRCKYKQSSTVVKLTPAGWEVLREGVYSKHQIAENITVRVLFLCTGNTCRSPIAEGMAKIIAAEKLHCGVDRLAQMGYTFESAGLMAMTGLGASACSVEFCRKRGADISGHQSRMTETGIVERSDYIFVMSHCHLDAIIKRYPQAAEKCFLLDSHGSIDDPIGFDTDIYNKCGRKIEKAVRERISEIIQ